MDINDRHYEFLLRENPKNAFYFDRNKIFLTFYM